jgi:PAS domain S-box-containing protein
LNPGLKLLAIGCAWMALSCPWTGLAQNRLQRSNDPAPGAAVRQARMNPHSMLLPVVDATDIRFTQLSTDQGLSQTRVIQILQDDQGFLWFGSQYGLNRYDGYKFKVFKHEPGNPNSLSGVFISSLFKDRAGMLWIGCDDYLDKFDPVTDSFTHYHIDTSDAQGETVPVTHISQDHTGMLWLSTLRGLFRFDPSTGKMLRYRHDPNDPFSLSSDEVKQSGEDREGEFWVATSEGLDAFDRSTGKVTLHVPLHEHRELSFYEDRSGVFWVVDVADDGVSAYDRKTNLLTHYSFRHGAQSLPIGVMAMLEDQSGAVWFATLGNGLLKFERKSHQVFRYRHDPADPDSLGEDDVATLFQDREGNIWAGLHMRAPTRFSTRPPLFEKFTNEPGNPNSMSGTMVNSIYQDSQGNLWIGSIDALNRVDHRTGRYTFYRNFGRGVKPRPTAIVGAPQGSLWIGTGGLGLIHYDPETRRFRSFRHRANDPRSLSSDNVAQLLLDHAGHLWIATFDGLNRFDPATSQFAVYKLDPHLPAEIDLTLQEDPQEKIWIGTHSSGLQQFDPVTERFLAHYTHRTNEPFSLSNNRVNSVHFDRSGTMWVGTQDGLDKFDARRRTFKTYYERDGLSGNVVSCILEDEHGHLWMSTNNGVSAFDPVRQTFRNYSTADGLPGADLSGWGACYKSPSGEMFFGGFDGGVAFYPDKVVDIPYVPPMVLTDMRLFNRPVVVGGRSPLHRSISYTSRLQLAHSQNIFSIEFAALSYFNSATNRYRYQLQGLDPQWHEVGSDQRILTYTTLPDGRYTLRVQGATSRGAWSNPGVVLRIRILPPWWGTWWFRLLCITAGLGFAWSLYRLRIRQIQHEEAALRSVIETIPTFAWTLLADGSVDFVNRHWQEYTGLSLQKSVGAGWRDAMHAQDLERHVEKWRVSLKTGAIFEDEVRYRRAADGKFRWFLVRAVPLRDEDGKVLCWYGISTDIEDRKLAEQEREQLRTDLAHVNRINTLGELAASVSHELKQPIAAAILNAQTCIRWLKRDTPDVEKALEAAVRIAKDGYGATEIIDRLRSLYKKSPPSRELVDVGEVVHEMLLLMRGEANRYGIVMRTKIESELPLITADRVQIQQVFLNLMLNAIEAMKEAGGELTINVEAEQDSQLEIAVSDTGPGLPVDEANNIFDAFFTTKPQGSGMGLAISRSIIESHGGRLWASNNDGPGATFHLVLPAKLAASSSSAR